MVDWISNVKHTWIVTAEDGERRWRLAAAGCGDGVGMSTPTVEAGCGDGRRIVGRISRIIFDFSKQKYLTNKTKRNTQHGAPVELRWLRGLIVHTTPEVSWKPISWSSVDPATKANGGGDWVEAFLLLFFSDTWHINNSARVIDVTYVSFSFVGYPPHHTDNASTEASGASKYPAKRTSDIMYQVSKLHKYPIQKFTIDGIKTKAIMGYGLHNAVEDDELAAGNAISSRGTPPPSNAGRFRVEGRWISNAEERSVVEESNVERLV
ncbi:hypothetical protein LXL04_025815 [Taraxacum kok-saghyz]